MPEISSQAEVDKYVRELAAQDTVHLPTVCATPPTFESCLSQYISPRDKAQALADFTHERVRHKTQLQKLMDKCEIKLMQAKTRKTNHPADTLLAAALIAATNEWNEIAEAMVRLDENEDFSMPTLDLVSKYSINERFVDNA